MTKLLHGSLIAKCFIDNNNNNELHTHQGMNRRQMQKVNLVLKEHSTNNKRCHQWYTYMQCEQSIHDFEISIYVFLIIMCLFNLTSHKQFFFFHIEKDIIRFRCWQYKASIYVTCVYDIVYKILKPYTRYVLIVANVWKSLPLDENKCWSQLS